MAAHSSVAETAYFFYAAPGKFFDAASSAPVPTYGTMQQGNYSNRQKENE
jgi:hypothetical protein